MLISLHKRLVFLAMTKTASTSIEDALLPLCHISFYRHPKVKHISYTRYKRFVLPYLEEIGFSNFETTCLIREPISWVFSWYKYRSRKEITGQPESAANISFDEFATSYVNEKQGFTQFGRQAQFISDNNARPAVNHIFRYENLPVFAKFLESRFDQPFEFKHLNPSPDRTLSLSPDVKKQLEEYLMPEYEIYESARGK